eukprot:c25313_g1_i1 orf=380-1363(+)
MDAKALLRSRMKEASQRREKHIDSPLVRYNEIGQPICKVCNVSIKSVSLWTAHLVSRQHKEAVDDIKSRAKVAGISSAKVTSGESVSTVAGPSSLPADFFDSPDAKRAKKGDAVQIKLQQTDISTRKLCGDVVSASLHHIGTTDPSTLAHSTSPQSSISASAGDTGISSELQQQNKGPEKFAPPGKKSELLEDERSEQVKGSLPEGFFDNVDADHKARGLQPPKYDIQDEWKEFQKSIREDLQEVDYRMEEEEFDAAEDREELEHLEQSALANRIKKLRKRQQEMATTKASTIKSTSIGITDMNEDSESDRDSEENLLIDWRAKQLK